MGAFKMKPLRAVVDTNIFISAVLFGGELEEIVSSWQKEKFVYLLSPQILQEYIKVLSYPKFELTVADIKHIIEKELIPFVEPVKVAVYVKAVKKDSSDDKFLALAIAGKADVIVSGDKHLLELKSFEKIPIITGREFLRRL